MPSKDLIAVNLTTVEKNTASLGVVLQTKNVAKAADSLGIALTTTNQMATAVGSSFRQVGIFIDADRGDGNLQRVNLAGARVEMHASLDGYARTISFDWHGVRRSPTLYSQLRSLRQVRVTGYLGQPGAVQSRQLFLGFLAQASFDAFPAVGHLQNQDYSLKWANTKLAYNLAPGSGKTRKDILLEIFTQYGIPYSILDLGPNDGGVIYKGISVGGDTKLLDWLRDFLRPIGRKIRFGAAGNINIQRFDTTAPVQREFLSGHISNLRITPPSVIEANAVQITASQFAYTGPSGTHTEVTDTVTTGLYTPQAAVTRQNHSTGAQTPLAITPDPTTMIGRIRTTTTYSGGTMVSQIIEQWGWYSAKACVNQQDAAGVVTYNASFDVYKYADGTWRMDASEQFQKIRETRVRRTFDATTGILQSERKEVDRFVQLEFPVSVFDNTPIPVTEHSIAGFLTEDGFRWWAGQQIVEFALPPTFGDVAVNSRYSTGTEIVTTGYAADSDGKIVSENRQVSFNSLVCFPVISRPSGTIGPGVFYGFGPSSSKRYGVFVSPANSGGPYTSTYYARIDDTSYKKTVFVQLSGSPNIQGGYAEEWFTGPGAGTSTIPGSVPLLEVLTAKQTAQQVTQTVKSDVQVALAGGTVIPFPVQNDFCETVGELQTAAFEELSDLLAFAIEWDMPMDLNLVDGQVVSLRGPELTGDAIKMNIWGIDWTFDGSNGTALMHLRNRYLPPELVALAAA